MLRDILQNKSQFLTIFLMVLIGVMVYVGIEAYMDGMISAGDKFYTEYNLQDLNVIGNSTSEILGIEVKDKEGKQIAHTIFVDDSVGLVRFLDDKDKFIKLDSDEGVYITYKMAYNEGYKIGDTIKWHIYGDKTYYESKIIGFYKDPQSQNLTMTKSYMESLGLKYKADSLYTNTNMKKVKDIKNVESIQDISALRSGMESMLSITKTMISLITLFAILLGVIIIYNMGILSYNEKQYQFATLKVLGFSDKKIKNIFIEQNIWITALSVIIGLPAGYYLAAWLV